MYLAYVRVVHTACTECTCTVRCMSELVLLLYLQTSIKKNMRQAFTFNKIPLDEKYDLPSNTKAHTIDHFACT